MKKQRFKMALHLLICIVACFICIYLFIFVGGWKLFASGDPLLIEIGVSLWLGVIIWIMFEQSRAYEKKFLELEQRIAELEREGNGHG